MKKKVQISGIFTIIIFFFSMNLIAQDLKNHQWEHRILIIKTLDVADAQFSAQLEEIKGVNEEMIERKFVVYTILGDVFTRINYKDSKNSFTTDKVSGRLKKILNDNEPFEVILIGLDGGIKLQQTKILTQKELFDKVDSMPMRRSELRRN